MKMRLSGIPPLKPTQRKILFIVLAVTGVGLTGFMLQDRYVTNRAIDNNRQLGQVEEQQASITKIPELKQTQDPSIANPNAKPGEVGEILINQPIKEIKYIRAGSLVLSPSTFTCYVGGGYSCTRFTMSASDGKPIMPYVKQNRTDMWVICQEDCYGPTQRTNRKQGVDYSGLGPGTYPMNLEAEHIDLAGNHLIYFGSLTLIVKEPDPGYVPPPEPTYDLGTPPYPLPGARPPAPAYCNGPSLTQPECY